MDMFTCFAYAFLLLVTLAVARFFSLLPYRRALRYPPGPSGRTITGNFFDIPRKKPWVIYAKWAQHYGDIMHLQMLGDHVIILSSVNIANDLLEKRSRVYSSRPHPEVAESSGWGFDIATQPYTNAWRKQRKTYQQHLRPDAIISWGIWISLSSMYGVTLRSANDPLLRLAKEAVHTLDTVFSTRYTFLVSYFPFIRFIPGWVPILGSIARFIECTKKLCHDLREIPFNQVIEDVESGLDNGGLIARVLRKDTTTTEEIGQIKDMAAITLIASADTTSSSLGTFFMAMAKNPQCQERAWQEIDAVRRGRLPTFEDRKSMPYVEAIYREVMRWHPAVPLGVAHSSIEDDIYNEYYLPRGSIVFANIWAMTHDERVYRDPYHFIPERFFNADGTLNDDDTVLGFGFGRRQGELQMFNFMNTEYPTEFVSENISLRLLYGLQSLVS
uniref:Putative cytochrome P450 n=1 Tax=Moniliophthora roreri TaxID=221103 RepID=A0A0W0F7N2_MONRR